MTGKEYLKIYTSEFKVINVEHAKDDRDVFCLIVTLQHDKHYLKYVGTADFRYKCWYRTESL